MMATSTNDNTVGVVTSAGEASGEGSQGESRTDGTGMHQENEGRRTEGTRPPC